MLLSQNEYIFVRHDKIALWLFKHGLYKAVSYIKYEFIDSYLYPRVEGSIVVQDQYWFFETRFPVELSWLKELHEYLGKPAILDWKIYA